MERAIEVYAVINFTIIGISHVVQPRAWVEFFVHLRERGEAGVFALRKLQIPSHERAYLFVAPGVLFLLLATALGYHLWATS